MKRLMSTWSEVRTFEFPDDAPTHNMEQLFDYVEQHPEADGDWSYFVSSVEPLEPTFEDACI